MGCSFEEWYEVIQTLSKTYRVLAFHRQGLGQSELGNGIQNIASTVSDLVEILNHPSKRRAVLFEKAITNPYSVKGAFNGIKCLNKRNNKIINLPCGGSYD